MRRLAALLLIATSGWLLYQVSEHFIGLTEASLSQRFVAQIVNINFLLPAIGGVLGMIGGLTIFLGGPGGAAIALIGGVVVAGFALSAQQAFNWQQPWKSEVGVGLTILILAGLASIMGRN